MIKLIQIDYRNLYNIYNLSLVILFGQTISQPPPFPPLLFFESVSNTFLNSAWFRLQQHDLTPASPASHLPPRFGHMLLPSTSLGVSGTLRFGPRSWDMILENHRNRKIPSVIFLLIIIIIIFIIKNITTKQRSKNIFITSASFSAAIGSKFPRFLALAWVATTSSWPRALFFSDHEICEDVLGLEH